MAEIKFTELNCQRCGGALEQKGDTYVCKNCGKMWQKETLHDFTDMLEACDQALRSQRVADIANLRQLLWREVNHEYVSNIQVEKLCRDIQKYLPQDFYASFYIATCSRDKTELGDFLYNVNLREHYEDIPLVVDYLLKSLKPEWVLGVSNFIEKIKDIDTALYFKYRTQFEEEYAKVEDGVFDAELKRDVFIAYSSKDMPKVMELVAALEEENIYCFVAARNMRHGSGSVENYRNLLHTAIENCTVFVFVSSDNSRSFNCDAYREEISYINQHRKDMPRVEYLIQNYSGRAVERNFKDFFSGLEYCLSPQSVAERVIDILMNSLQTEEEPSVVETPKVIEVSKTIITNTTKPAALDPDELEKRLKRALSLMQAGEFEEAKKRLDKIESDVAAVTGECEVIEVYHYKLWADYAVTSDDGLVEKLIKEQADVTKNKNYILAMGFAEETKDEAWINALNSIKVKAQNGIAEAKAKAEEERKRREAEVKRKHQEEEERKCREEAEARARAETERKRREEAEARAKAEAERQRIKDEELKKSLQEVGCYWDIDEGYITFGTYPQSRKASNVQIGNIFDSERDYYLGNDDCLYAEWEGEYYKVEPIKWKVLKHESELFIASDIILDAHRFDENSNNYANSEIRSWLNGEFYKKAFTRFQRNLILPTMVDNSVASTGDRTNQYVCDNTNDKIFLLSCKEVKDYYKKRDREKTGSAYAKARGLGNSIVGTHCWWFRSPDFDNSNSVHAVDAAGGFYSLYIKYTYIGVSPALKIKP